MPVPISIREALMIESLINNKMTKEEILQSVQKNDVQKLNNVDNTFDYSYLIDVYRENPEIIDFAIMKSYQIKFVTKNGLKTLLDIKFGLKEKKDYEFIRSEFSFPSVNQRDLNVLENILSTNWKVERIERIDDDLWKAKIFNPMIT